MSARALIAGFAFGAMTWLGLAVIARLIYSLGGWPVIAAAATGVAGFTVVILAWPVRKPAKKEEPVPVAQEVRP